MKPIGICSDHAGFEAKELIKQWLEENELQYVDFGTSTPDSCDYPDFAHPLSAAVTKGECRTGIGICGTGNGIAMTANKYPSIRAALCWSPEIVRYARQHNDANILVLPGRYLSNEQLIEMVRTYLDTPFEGGRHQRRIDKIPIH